MKNPPKKKLSKPLVVAVIFMLAVVAILLAKSMMWGKLGVSNSVAARTMGSPNAKVHIIEYLDFQCPACAYGAKEIKKYHETFHGQVYLEVKYFPLGGHMHSLEAAKFAECSARQGKFWPFFDLVFERQKQWADLFDAQPVFMKIVEEIGADSGKILSCIAQDDVRKEILADKDAGQAKGVQSTPTYFINDQMFVGAKRMKEEVERLLGADKMTNDKAQMTNESQIPNIK